ncbi:Glutathione transport system permease protein GsiD [Anaerolineae bacterium]|nr:Glutathione transport system permease protein GsiD [Anaerolineae bacterium]
MISLTQETTRILKNRIAVERQTQTSQRWHVRVPLNLWIGGLIVALVLLIAGLAPFIAPFAPDQVMAGARLAPPSFDYPFGTDSLGRDMLSRVLLGTRLAVWTMLLGVSIAALLGIVPGLIAGYVGGWGDQVLSRVMDMALAFPGLLLALIIVARFGPSLDHALIAMGVISAPSFYRLTRSQTISARKMLYVDAARAIGANTWRILFRHIAPNLASSLIVIATMRAGILLVASGGLSFVGLGAQPPSPEWGTLLAAGRNYLETAPWLAIFPGLCITLTVIGTNLLGDGLRDALDLKNNL